MGVDRRISLKTSLLGMAGFCLAFAAIARGGWFALPGCIGLLLLTAALAGKLTAGREGVKTGLALAVTLLCFVYMVIVILILVGCQ